MRKHVPEQVANPLARRNIPIYFLPARKNLLQRPIPQQIPRHLAQRLAGKKNLPIRIPARKHRRIAFEIANPQQRLDRPWRAVDRLQPINGTPRTTETLLRFGDFECYPTMFPRVYPNGDVFYPCEPLHKIAGNLLRDGSLKKIFARGKKIYGDIPPCQGICYLFGNVLSHYYVNDFWGLARDFIR